MLLSLCPLSLFSLCLAFLLFVCAVSSDSNAAGGEQMLTRPASLSRSIDVLFKQNRLSHVDHAILHGMRQSSDVVLEAAFANYFSSRDFDEFCSTLIHLAGRWRRQGRHRFFHAWIKNNRNAKLLTRNEVLGIERLLLKQSPALLNAEEEWRNALQAANGSSTAMKAASRHFFLQLLSIIEQQWQSSAEVQRALHNAHHWIGVLRSRFLLPQADLQYLTDCVKKNEPTIIALFADYAEKSYAASTAGHSASSDVGDDWLQQSATSELFESLIHLSTRWQRRSADALLLQWLKSLPANTWRRSDVATLELLVYQGNAPLTAAYDLYMHDYPHAQGRAAVELEDTLHRILDRSAEKHRQECALLASAYLKHLKKDALVTAAGGAYLTHLLEAGDDVLLASFSGLASRGDDDAADYRSEDEELLDTVLRIASRWQKTLDASQQSLYELFLGLHAAGSLSDQHLDYLAHCIYIQHPVLLAAYSIYQQESQDSHEQVWTEFWDSVARIVNAAFHSHELENEISHLLRAAERLHSTRVLSSNEYQHLSHLILNGDHATLDAALHEYLREKDRNKARHELNDTLIALAVHYRRHHPLSHLLSYFLRLQMASYITFAERDLLEALAYQENIPLLSAFSLWKHSSHHAKDDEELWQTICHILGRQLNLKYESMKEHAINAIANTHQRYSVHRLTAREVLPSADAAYLMEVAKTFHPPEAAEPLFAALEALGEGVECDEIFGRIGRMWRLQEDQQTQNALAFIHNLHPMLLSAEIDALQLAVYRHDLTLMAALSLYAQQLQHATNTKQSNAAWEELKDTFSAVMAAHQREEMDFHAQKALYAIEALAAQPETSKASIVYLRYLLQAGDERLLAIGAAFNDDGNESECFDSLRRLGEWWKHSASLSHQQLLQVCDAFVNEGHLSYSMAQTLELLIYHDWEPLFAAYSIYAAEGFSRTEWLEFWDSVCHLLRRFHFPKEEITENIASQHQQLIRCMAAIIDGSKEKSERKSSNGWRRQLPSASFNTCLHSSLSCPGQMVLEASFLEYRDSGDAQEFHDTALRIADRLCPHHTKLRQNASITAAL